MDEDLVASGRFARLETQGRRSGDRRPVTIGFVEEADGSLLVAAGEPGADWAANLDLEPGCRVTIGDLTRAATAEPLDGADFARAIRELILRYGTTAEGLGSGPAYRLRFATGGGGRR
jgi:deazaflavin-dependent oxidoreductase (nitroreductase family)